MERDKTSHASPHIGLCGDCRYTRQLVSGKGSQFFYCTRAETDARYTKYPPLPVTSCRGYERDPGSQTEQ